MFHIKNLKNNLTSLALILSVIFVAESHASSDTLLLHDNDAVVWHYEQKITGELSGFTAEKVIVHHNDNSFATAVTAGNKFSFHIILHDLKNKIWVEVPGDPAVVSDTLNYQLGYNPLPVVKPFATITGEKAILHAAVIENPYQANLKYVWMPDSLNPEPCQVVDNKDSIASVKIPDTHGTYNFNLLVIAGNDSTWFQTFVLRDEGGLHPFDMGGAYPQWMDSAIIYQITPYSFVKNGTFEDITAKLPEIRSLGINTVWLQPVFKSYHGGQGYDVINYLEINPDLGSEKQLQQLIATAKDLGMRVLFDVVLNHTSIHHPYAKDRKKHGTQSHYYDFYQHEKDGKPYSSFYNKDKYGFINYFWDDLVNLNYQHIEVQRWMLEVCKYWVKKFDIDGYRFDAIWGVNARRPAFAQRLRTELKSIKPDVLMLAEDKGSVPEVFELGFDAAYDWTADTSWVSQWSWEHEYEPRESHTIFNFHQVDDRDEMLEQALFHYQENDHRLLRYMENNDLPRFIEEHGLNRTKMVAALLFAIPGIPMLYNGQEIGFRGHPYATSEIFKRDSAIQALDEEGLFKYYQKLIQIHKQHPALWGIEMRPLSVSPDEAVVAFHRWQRGEDFVIIVNMDSADMQANVDIRELVHDSDRARKHKFKDLLSNETFKSRRKLPVLEIPMQKYSVRWLLLEE